MKQESLGSDPGMQNGGEETQEERNAEGEVSILSIVQTGNNLGMEHTVDERGNGENKADERTGSADVKERAGGANRRTNQNESAEGTDERRKRNKKRIAGTNVMMTASENMAEFVSEKYGEQSEGEGQAGGEGRGVFVKKREGFDKLVKRNGLILGIGDSELSAGDKASAKSEKEKNAGEIEGLERRWRRDGDISRLKKCCGTPIQVNGNGWRRVFRERIAHEAAGVMNRIDTTQYSTSGLVRASCGAAGKLPGRTSRVEREEKLLGLFSLFVDALEFFAGFEADGFSGRDVDLFAGAGIAADAGLARLDAEDAEAAKFDALAAAESLLQRFENSFDSLLGFGAADVRRSDDGINDVQLDHAILQRFRGRC
jgi:hypothetical protein